MSNAQPQAQTAIKPIPLTRETLKSGELKAWLKKNDAGFTPLDDAEIERSRHAMFGGKPPQEDVWLFGYGSLSWNPTIEFDAKLCGITHGYHRKFCLETRLGRGSPEQPGLVLGLDRGGSCRGLVFRIPGAKAEEELDLVWRREMISNAYRPTWLTVRTDADPVRAIGFVMNRRHERYCGDKCDEQTADMIAAAGGFLGPCSDYLFNTVDHLAELGMPDAGLARLAKKVRARQAAR